MSIQRLFIGIDPGITGAIAFIDEKGQFVSVHDMPIMKVDKGNEVNTAALSKLFRDVAWGVMANTEQWLVSLEKVHSMPGQGVSSTFRFGESYGAIKGVLGAMMLRYQTVTPQAWKKHMKLSGKDKDVARGVAQQLFPQASLDRKKDVGRADALLIARYGLEAS